MLSAEKQGKRENGNVKGDRKTLGGGDQGVLKSKKAKSFVSSVLSPQISIDTISECVQNK